MMCASEGMTSTQHKHLKQMTTTIRTAATATAAAFTAAGLLLATAPANAAGHCAEYQGAEKKLCREIKKAVKADLGERKERDINEIRSELFVEHGVITIPAPECRWNGPKTLYANNEGCIRHNAAIMGVQRFVF